MNKNPYFFVISIAVVAFMGCGFQEPDEDTSSSDTEIGEISTIVGPGLRHEPSADPADPQNGGEPPYSQDPHGSGGEEGNDPQVAPAVDGGVGNDPTTSPSEEPVVDGGTAPAVEDDPPAEEDPVVEEEIGVFGVEAAHIYDHDDNGNATTVRTFGVVFQSLAVDVVVTFKEIGSSDVFYTSITEGPVSGVYITMGGSATTPVFSPNTTYEFTVTANGTGALSWASITSFKGEFTTGDHLEEEPQNGWIVPALSSSSYGTTCTLHFGARYIGNDDGGEARGTIPGMSWGSGPDIEDLDSDDEDLEWTLDARDAVVGTYDVSYVSDTGEWANFGDSGSIAATAPQYRSFVECTWWNEDAGETVSVSNPGCGLKVRVIVESTNGQKRCSFAPAGNMSNYTGE